MRFKKGRKNLISFIMSTYVCPSESNRDQTTELLSTKLNVSNFIEHGLVSLILRIIFHEIQNLINFFVGLNFLVLL
jgi:hypothetical protein